MNMSYARLDERSGMAITVWQNEWDEIEDWSGGGGRERRLPRGDKLGATLYELPPEGFVVYHFHHSWEELLVVLRGRLTLRTSSGERELEEGEVVHFPRGPEGVHAFYNRSSEPARYLMASTLELPEVAEYPDLKKITAQARTGSQTGEHLWLIHDLDQEEQ
jgi:uncharacterized cupin superfamily protein